ncbi:hypothetical protein [Nocardia sp. bgisy118]|uniref:hypothetical protein n=1 Tax=Nocardia sp. bgisy118 TaxID=3413786 RepID=UPI003F4A22D0
MSDHLSRLRDVRDNLTRRMNTAPDYAAAGLAKTLAEVLERIEELEAPSRPKPKTPLDEVMERLAAKRVPVADDGISQRSV